jgi:glycosyltransferase involved in cell wall biosynthesis
MPDFSIVVPTWNRRDTLEVVLPALLRQQFEGSYEILLCDSGSTDGTDELVKDIQAGLSDDRRTLRHLVGPNRGRSGARNMGIREAQGRLILFTDADIIADPRLLAEHARVHAEHAASHPNRPECAVVGREVQVDTLDEYERVRDNPAAGRYLHPDKRKTISWLYFLTGNASAPRQTLVDVGGFDENFTGYGHEDLELGYRLQRQGLLIRYCATAVNYHWHPVSFDEKCQKMKLAGVSTIRFYNKHRDPRIKLLLGTNIVSLTVHSGVRRMPWLVDIWQQRSQRSKLASELVLQYHYLCGVKEGMQKLGHPPARHTP